MEIQAFDESRRIKRDGGESHELDQGKIRGSDNKKCQQNVKEVKPAKSNEKQGAVINAEITEFKRKREVIFEAEIGKGDNSCERGDVESDLGESLRMKENNEPQTGAVSHISDKFSFLYRV